MAPAARLNGWRRPRFAAAAVVIVAAVAVAGALAISSARASTTATLGVASAKVGSRTERIIVDVQGVAVYDLTGDTPQHPLCTASSCRSVWHPLTVASGAKPSKASGISGTLATWRHDGLIQLTLGGHPLYTFVGDAGRKGVATGDGIKSFGGVWFVLPGGAATHGGRASAPSPAW